MKFGIQDAHCVVCFLMRAAKIDAQEREPIAIALPEIAYPTLRPVDEEGLWVREEERKGIETWS